MICSGSGYILIKTVCYWVFSIAKFLWLAQLVKSLLKTRRLPWAYAITTACVPIHVFHLLLCVPLCKSLTLQYFSWEQVLSSGGEGASGVSQCVSETEGPERNHYCSSLSLRNLRLRHTLHTALHHLLHLCPLLS